MRATLVEMHYVFALGTNECIWCFSCQLQSQCLEIIGINGYWITYKKLYLLSATMRIDAGTGLAALEHESMTLSCAARGSKNIVFRWFKDGYLLDLSLFQRRAQETLIPSSRDDIITSVLTFDRVSPLDRGTFMCEARDGGRSENKSLIINVITVPLVDLYPLSVSVVEGESTSIICMSPEDTDKNFTYSWHMEGSRIQLGRSDHIVEDLFPTGTRLYVPKVKKSANFSCTVENRAGVFSLTSFVFMQKVSSENMTCGRSYHKQVLWKKTAGNHFDKERCPSETGGYATRHCVCSGDGCVWEEPNFAKCQSVYLIYEVYDKLEMLRLGYQQTTIKYVFDRLCEFMVKNSDNLYSGDVELAVGILHELLKHLVQFPQLAVKDDKISVKSLVELMNIMINAANQSTSEEKHDMKAAPYFLKICQIISRSVSSVLFMDTTAEISSSSLDVITQKLQVESRNVSTTASVLDKHSRKEEIYVISFMNKVIQSLLAAKIMKTSPKAKNPISNVQSVFPLNGSNTDIANTVAFIPIKHNSPSSFTEYNHTVCVSWEFDERKPEFGHWTDKHCTAVGIENGKTICKCTIPGHFMVISVPTNKTVIEVAEESYPGLPIIIACVINITILTVAIFLYIIKNRLLIGDQYPIYLCFKVSILLTTIMFLVCLRNEINSVLCNAGQIIIYFSFMAAFALLFAESMQIFISMGRKHQTQRQWHKYMCIGWGIPTALTAFFAIASKIFKDPGPCIFICWIDRGHWHFYGFIIPVVALNIAFFTMLIFALRSCIKFQDESKYTPKKKFFITCLKSTSVLILLDICSYTSTGLNNKYQTENIIVYSVMTVIMVVLVFMTRCLFDKQILTIVWNCRPTLAGAPPLVKRNSSSSFKAYMKPELVQKAVPEREVINKHYDHVNRTKFTDERKRQLSYLLGSSQSGAHLSPHNNCSEGTNSFPHPSDNTTSDSGIFGSENENFINGLEASNQPPLFNETITVDVHSPLNGSDNIEPFPELIQRNGCKNILLQTSRSNGIVRPKDKYYTVSKVNTKSGESTAMLLSEKKNDGNESDSL